MNVYSDRWIGGQTDRQTNDITQSNNSTTWVKKKGEQLAKHVGPLTHWGFVD